MEIPNIQINDIRKDIKIEKLDDIVYGKCFIYKEMLYINMGYNNIANQNFVYNLYSCDTDYLPGETQVTPVKIKIDIIK